MVDWWFQSPANAGEKETGDDLHRNNISRKKRRKKENDMISNRKEYSRNIRLTACCNPIQSHTFFFIFIMWYFVRVIFFFFFCLTFFPSIQIQSIFFLLN